MKSQACRRPDDSGRTGRKGESSANGRAMIATRARGGQVDATPQTEELGVSRGRGANSAERAIIIQGSGSLRCRSLSPMIHKPQQTPGIVAVLMETLKRVCLDVEAAKNCAAFNDRVRSRRSPNDFSPDLATFNLSEMPVFRASFVYVLP